jgi:alpha-beta hydrolase superfamily lysophospholipase
VAGRGEDGEMRMLWRWSLRAVWSVLLVLVTVMLVQAFKARGLPPLQVWHREAPQLELTAEEMDQRGFDFARYLEREDEVIRESRLRVDQALAPEDDVPGMRYAPSSPNNPVRFETDWNRSFERRPAKVRGGALLVHGMTDAPYSMRPLAALLERQGWYVLSVRMPGHGTVPAGLATAQWEDWFAAVSVAARHVRAEVGADAPLLMAGYSNGGALVLEHQLDAIDHVELPRADRIVLISPMIGIAPGSGLARVIGLLSFIPYFEQSAWLDIQPEFNPFKYNSFPVNAGLQSVRLTREIQADLDRHARAGTLSKLPPVLTFQSVLDDTVQSAAVITRLYDQLPANGSELVLFDINRAGALLPLFSSTALGFRDTLGRAGDVRRWGVTVVHNTRADTRGVSEWRVAAGATEPTRRELGLEFPREVYSLSHIALPFPLDDPLYGLEPDKREDFGIRLGRLALRGERRALVVPVDQFARLGCNPFFPYLAERTREWSTAALQARPVQE